MEDFDEDTKEGLKNQEEAESDVEPDNKEDENKNKKLYRNPDDVIIAGVCSGLAAYFGIDPVAVRLAFFVAIFAQGLGFWIYIILWIVMPMAKNSAQKLEMRGKPVNIKRIEENIKEKSKHIREGIKKKKISKN